MIDLTTSTSTAPSSCGRRFRIPESGRRPGEKATRPRIEPVYLPVSPAMRHNPEPTLNPSMRYSGPKGFTLIELLISITIIIVLAALVFTVTGKVRSKAFEANAVTALRQVGTAHIAYAADNNGAINMLRDVGERQQEGRGGRWVADTFWGRMQPYLFTGIESGNQARLKQQLELSINGFFNSTNAKTMAGTPFQGVAVYGDLSGLPVPFGFNGQIRPAWNQPQTRLASVGDPARTIYCAYGRYFLRVSDGKEYRPLPTQGGSGARGYFFLNNRSAIVCFLDGHVEMLTPPIPDRLYE